MDQEEKIKLTAAELAQLWGQYLNDSGSICVLTFFLEKAEDDDIKPLIEFALQLSTSHIEKLTSIFTAENYTVPDGFTVEADVDTKAPKLYSDYYVLQFLHQMAKIGLNNYSASVAASVREDVTDYFMNCLNETMQLYKKSKEILLSKGLYIRTPHVPTLGHVEYVKKQGFLLDVVGEKRPLAVSEIGNLYANLQRNTLGAATLMGFSQVTKDKDIKQFLLKGIDIAKKHVKLFGEKLEESNLPVPMTMAAEVSDSTAYTFSDKLMMFFTSALIPLSVGYYGTAVVQSPRVDLGVMYNRLSLEVQLYSEDGSNIMINHKWLEQPPMALDRDELINERHEE